MRITNCDSMCAGADSSRLDATQMAAGAETRVMVIRADAAQLARVRQVLGQAQLACEVLHEPTDCAQAPVCRWFDPDQLTPPAQAHAALADAIEVLERSRHAFRSRELGSLRRRLENVLRELSADD